jgi:hypothetical protein
MAHETKGSRKKHDAKRRSEARVHASLHSEVRDEWLGDVRCGAAALEQLVDAALAIDAVDDVVRGFGEPADRRRLEAARKVLAEGLQERIPDVERSLSHVMMGMRLMPDKPDDSVLELICGVMYHLGGLATTARRATAKLGKLPSRSRRVAGYRAWTNRERGEREAKQAGEAA